MAHIPTTPTPAEDEAQPANTQAPSPRLVPAPAPSFSPGVLFRGRQLLFTLLVLLAALVMVGLGIWQLQRRAQRLASNAHITQRLSEPALTITGPVADPAALEFRRVTVTGTFDYANEIILRNRTRDERPGVHVITPLRISGSDKAVLVDRGWIPYEQTDPQARRAFRGPTTAEVRGIVHASQSPPGGLGPVDPPVGPGRPRLDAWYRIDVPHIQQQTPYPLLPFYIEQSPQPGAPDLPWRSEEDVALDEGPHLSYAIQWFSFATILIVGYTVRAGHVKQPAGKRRQG